MPGSELPARTLSEILAPNRLMVNHTFELNVDQWKFVGHPFSVQNESFDKFNITFIIEVHMLAVCLRGKASKHHITF